MLPAFQTDPHPLNLGIITLPVKEQNLPQGERTRRRETRRGRGRDLSKRRMRSWRRGVGENVKMGEKRLVGDPTTTNHEGEQTFHFSEPWPWLVLVTRVSATLAPAPTYQYLFRLLLHFIEFPHAGAQRKWPPALPFAQCWSPPKDDRRLTILGN